jgi:FkbM family methyltransferase
MAWWNAWRRRLRWKLVRGSRLPKASLHSCLLNLEARGFRPRHIVDVGANRARWSRDAAWVFPDCRFTLIEPQQEMERHLARFCKGRPERRYVIAGAGAQAGQMLLTVHSLPTASNFVMTPQQAAARGFLQRPVPIVTIDGLLEQHGDPPPDVIKIDAERMEQDVLRGARKALARTELVFIEAHFLADADDPSDFAAIAGAMSDLGFAVYDFTWFGGRGRDGSAKLCEAAFARRDGFFRAVRDAARRAA